MLTLPPRGGDLPNWCVSLRGCRRIGPHRTIVVVDVVVIVIVIFIVVAIAIIIVIVVVPVLVIVIVPASPGPRHGRRLVPR